jgi:hypothetical protein
MIQSIGSGLPTRNCEVVEHVRDIEAGDDGRDRAEPVDDADPERRESARARRHALPFWFQEKTRKIRPSTQEMWMPRCSVSCSRPKPAV